MRKFPRPCGVASRCPSIPPGTMLAATAPNVLTRAPADAANRLVSITDPVSASACPNACLYDRN
jgi:hypothetical protein